jgi:hypothetical protein
LLAFPLGPYDACHTPDTVPVSKLQVCVVPKLEGKTRKAANKALKRGHCNAGKVSGPRSGRVRRQSRTRGKVLPAGAKINLTRGRK